MSFARRYTLALLSAFATLAGCRVESAPVLTTEGSSSDAALTTATSSGSSCAAPDATPPVEDASVIPDATPPIEDVVIPDSPANACDAAAPVVASSYSAACQTDLDCVQVPPGGSACDPCLFTCKLEALNKNAAARYTADYMALLADYPAPPGSSCVLGCPYVPVCCVGGTCRTAGYCALDATPDQ